MTEMAQDFLSRMPEKVAADVSKLLVSPMPGLVKAVSCAVGDLVAEGQELCVIGQFYGPNWVEESVSFVQNIARRFFRATY